MHPSSNQPFTEQQMIVPIAVFFAFITYLPVAAVALNQYWHVFMDTMTVTKGEETVHKHKLELHSHAASGMRFYQVWGFLMYGLMAAAITFYYVLAGARDSGVSLTLYYFTIFGYFLFIAGRTISNLIVAREGDASSAMAITVICLLLSIWLVVSSAYTVAKLNVGGEAGIIYDLVIFSMVFLWSCWYTHYVRVFKNNSHAFLEARAKSSSADLEYGTPLIRNRF